MRSIGTARVLRTPQELEDFEQDLVDQYAVTMSAAGVSDRHISQDRAIVFSFIRFLGRPVWTTTPEDADRFLVHLRKDCGQAKVTVQQKAWTVAQFFDYLIVRHQGDIRALTDCEVMQPIDEYNRPAKADYGIPRIPPSEQETDKLFAAWRLALPDTRRYLPAARDHVAASLWRRVGLRIGETVMLDIRDWRPNLGELGKLHIRYGKGSKGRGPKARIVPAINSVDALMNWWLTDVRHQFGDDWTNPDAPLLPSERRDPYSGMCMRVGTNALRSGLAEVVERSLPSWAGKLTPHVLRHFCASSLYARGVDLKAIQELLGHEWLATTTRYINPRELHQTGEKLQVAC